LFKMIFLKNLLAVTGKVLQLQEISMLKSKNISQMVKVKLSIQNSNYH